jgi:hypothetical protein
MKLKLDLEKIQLIPEKEWVSIFQSREPFSIEIRKLKLEDEGIAVFILNQVDSSYNTFGYIHLHVRQEDEIQARKILEQLA